MEERFRWLWQKIKQHRVTIGVVAIVFVVVIAIIIAGYWFDWTGFNGYNKITIAHTISGANTGSVIRTEEYQNAIPRRERSEVQAELVGIWEQPTKEEALTQLAALKAKYAHRYPEAVRSLSEDEEHPLFILCFPREDASAYSDHQCY